VYQEEEDSRLYIDPGYYPGLPMMQRGAETSHYLGLKKLVQIDGNSKELGKESVIASPCHVTQKGRCASDCGTEALDIGLMDLAS